MEEQKEEPPIERPASKPIQNHDGQDLLDALRCLTTHIKKNKFACPGTAGKHGSRECLKRIVVSTDKIPDMRAFFARTDLGFQFDFDIEPWGQNDKNVAKFFFRKSESK